jgi:pyruvate formate lyase activating enzyme
MAFTYNEPTIFLEYALDTATLAKQKGGGNLFYLSLIFCFVLSLGMTCIFKSNGYESEFAIDRCVGLIDAFNIDLKSFSDKFYRTLCKARLQPVLDTIKRLYDKKIWVEVTTLVIPGENDSDEELTAIAEFIASISKDIPWHVTPFYPDYKMTDKMYIHISFICLCSDQLLLQLCIVDI